MPEPSQPRSSSGTRPPRAPWVLALALVLCAAPAWAAPAGPRQGLEAPGAVSPEEPLPGVPQGKDLGLVQERRDVAVLKLQVLGTTREVEVLFKAALYEELHKAGLRVVPDTEVDAKIARDPSLLGCQTRTCFARVALNLGVGAVVEGEIARPQRSTYTVELKVRDLSTGKLRGAPVGERCEICGTEEARQMVRRAARRLATLIPRIPAGGPLFQATTGVLEVAADPRGATIALDGEVQSDRAPATFLLGIGVHRVELSAPGYKTVRRPVEIGPGQRVAVNIELPVLRPKRPWLTALSVFTLSGAVGLGVTAIVLGAYNGTPVYSDTLYNNPCQSPSAHCPNKWDFLAPAAGFGAAAGVLAVGAVLSLTYEFAPLRHRPPVPLTPAPAVPPMVEAATPPPR